MPRHLRAGVALVVALGSLGALREISRAQPAPSTPATPSAAPDATPPDPGLFGPTAPVAPTTAATSPSATSDSSPADDSMGDQEISAELGLASGGRVTPGGLRIAGHYLYQLSDRDWFDGAANFTFGSGTAACFRDRDDAVICDHGLTDGAGFEIAATIRRMFPSQGAFRPFARAGVGFGLARFGDDDVSGFTVALHGGGGVRVIVAPSIAVVAEGELVLGFGSFNRGLGFEPQLGLTVTAGVEFRLR